MYRNRHAMRWSPSDHPSDGPAVFATHSTHKLLAALSETSSVHIRDGRGAIDEAVACRLAVTCIRHRAS